MQITELVWNLFLLLLPGVVSTLIIRYISTNKNYTPFDFIIYSASLGIAIIMVMEIGYSIFNIFHSLFSSDFKIQFGLNLKIWDNLFGQSKIINENEVFVSYLVALPIGILFGIIIRKKLIIKLFQKIGLTNRYGDDDVWNHFLNNPLTEWVFVRDKVSKLTYFGYVKEYSDSNEIREILLDDVSVYSSETEELMYEVNSVYLELNSYTFTIEKPKPNNDEKDKKSQ